MLLTKYTLLFVLEGTAPYYTLQHHVLVILSKNTKAQERNG
jgi:hypothetical protein